MSFRVIESTDRRKPVKRRTTDIRTKLPENVCNRSLVFMCIHIHKHYNILYVLEAHFYSVAHLIIIAIHKHNIITITCTFYLISL